MVRIKKISAGAFAKLEPAQTRRDLDRESAEQVRQHVLRGDWESVRLEAEVMLIKRPGDTIATQYLNEANEWLTGEAQTARVIKITPQVHTRLINRAREISEATVQTDTDYLDANVDLENALGRRNIAALVAIVLAVLAVSLFKTSYWSFALLPAGVAGAIWWLLGTEATACRQKMYDRREAIAQGTVRDLALQRDLKNQDSDRFYASAEWKAIRQQVLDAGPTMCALCQVPVNGWDASVDHILPRSRFPHLSLQRSNLQLLCRSCNSAKSDRVFEG